MVVQLKILNINGSAIKKYQILPVVQLKKR